MRRIFIFTILCALTATYIHGQQAPLYSQYILNEFLLNPAVAGIDGMTTINFTGRKQWIGIQNSPSTYSASISTRVLKSPFTVSKQHFKRGSKGRVGLGMAFSNDLNGAISRTNLKLSYAYHIFIDNSQLSFGLEGLLGQFRINEELIEFRDADPNQALLGKSAFIPDAGAGINYSMEKGHIGISVINLLESAVKFGEINVDSDELRNIRQYTFFGVYHHKLTDRDWEFEPSVLVRANEDLRFSVDVSGRLIYQREYWAGLSFRSSKEFVILAGLKVNRIYIGYSFDYGFNQLSYSSYGSHEIVAAIKLGDSTRRYRWLERY